MRKILTFLLALCLVAGCTSGGKNHSGSSGDPAGKEPLSLTISTYTIQVPAANTAGKAEVVQAKITWNRILLDSDEFSVLDRTGDNGKFMVVAALIAAYKTWTPEDMNTCEDIMQQLLNSPSAPDSYTKFTRSFVQERMMQNEKWKFIADAYFDGAAFENNYTPSTPLTLTLTEYPYAPQKSELYEKELWVEKIVVKTEGADSERLVSVYQDPEDGKWYIWSDSYGSLLADIRME